MKRVWNKYVEDMAGNIVWDECEWYFTEDGFAECKGGGGGQTQTQRVEPATYLRPFLQEAAQEAQSIFAENPIQQFPESRVVPFSPQTQTALQGIESIATQDNPLLAASQNAILGSARGDFLTANPYLDQAINTATEGVARRFERSVLPNIQADFARSGRFGSGLQADAVGAATEAFTDQVGDIATRIAYGNYGDERSRQMDAARLAPAVSQARFQDLGRLLEVGGIREQMQEQMLQDEIDRFNFESGGGRQANLSRYLQNLGVVSPLAGQNTTSTERANTSGLANTVGLAALGLGGLGQFGGGGQTMGIMPQQGASTMQGILGTGGTAAGTAIGGPVGGAIGGFLGNTIGGLF